MILLESVNGKFGSVEYAFHQDWFLFLGNDFSQLVQLSKYLSNDCFGFACIIRVYRRKFCWKVGIWQEKLMMGKIFPMCKKKLVVDTDGGLLVQRREMGVGDKNGPQFVCFPL
jgi:hypothetical protein